MRVLLVCAGGYSTSFLMKKIDKYCSEQSIDLSIGAVSINDFEKHCNNYDVILIGPQIGYSLEEIRQQSNLPCAVIDTTDYALGRVNNILKIAEELLTEEGK